MRTLSLLPILLSCLVGCSAVPRPKQYYAEHEYPLLIKMGFAGGPAGHKLVNPAPGMDIGCDEEWAYGKLLTMHSADLCRLQFCQIVADLKELDEHLKTL